MVSDDGGFFDFNDAWVQFRGSTGLQIRTNDPNWAILVNTMPAKYREHPHVGVIAQSMPEEVVDNSGPVMGINLADTIGYTIVALRGLRAETREATNDLHAQIKQRDKKIEDLERRVSELEGKR